MRLWTRVPRIGEPEGGSEPVFYVMWRGKFFNKFWLASTLNVYSASELESIAQSIHKMHRQWADVRNGKSAPV